MSTQEYERQWAYIGDTTYRETEDELVMRLGALSYGAPKVHRILDSFVLATDSPVLRLRTIEVEGRSFARSYEATVKIGKKPDRREYTWQMSHQDHRGGPCIIKDRYPYETGDLKCHYEIARPNCGNPVLLFEIEGPKGQVDSASPSLVRDGWIETTRMPDFGGLLLAVCGRPSSQRIAAMSTLKRRAAGASSSRRAALRARRASRYADSRGRKDPEGFGLRRTVWPRSVGSEDQSERCFY